MAVCFQIRFNPVIIIIEPGTLGSMWWRLGGSWGLSEDAVCVCVCVKVAAAQASARAIYLSVPYMSIDHQEVTWWIHDKADSCSVLWFIL